MITGNGLKPKTKGTVLKIYGKVFMHGGHFEEVQLEKHPREANLSSCRSKFFPQSK